MAETPDLMKQVLGSPRLPSLPAVAVQLIDQVQDDEVAIDEIAQSITCDPALASKILKTVNSSFYGQSSTIGSIQQAVMVLGLNSVKTLALGFSLVNNLTDSGDKDSVDLIELWRRSLFGATAAKRICEMLNVVQMEEMFLASLLQDVGVLALSQVLDERYAAVYALAKDDHRQLARHEQSVFGCDHTQIGDAMASNWGLPPLLVQPIRHHENPDDAPEELRQLVRIVAAGACVAEYMLNPEDQARASDYLACMQRWFNLEAEASHQLLGEFQRESCELQRLFEIPAGELETPEQIMTRAGQALEKLAIDAVEQAKQLEQDNTELREAAYTDPLTGAINRRGFDEQIAEQFLHAGKGRPLALLFLDIDHFKRVNDTHGHQTGDLALAGFAEVATNLLGDSGRVYRYGGEEFAILCPGMDRKQAASLAEQVRLAVQQTGFMTEAGEPLSLTTSIGVSVYEGSTYRRPDQLIHAADSSVFAAKDAGRNQVRVFVPRQATPGESPPQAA